jgi:hypothetical protein
MNSTASRNDAISALLSNFPGPIRLVPSKRKWLKVLIGCAAFVAIGIWMIGDDATSTKTYHGIPALYVGWIATLFFGLGLIISIITMLPGASSLTLSVDGFAIRQMFRDRIFSWTDADNFAVVTVNTHYRLQRLVGFNHGPSGNTALGRANVALTGRNAALPDSYGFAEEDLVRLMSLWRVRALS